MFFYDPFCDMHQVIVALIWEKSPNDVENCCENSQRLSNWPKKPLKYLPNLDINPSNPYIFLKKAI